MKKNERNLENIFSRKLKADSQTPCSATPFSFNREYGTSIEQSPRGAF